MKWFALLFMIFFMSGVSGQNQIRGTVKAPDNEPLTGVTVYLPELNKGTFTGNDGSYLLSDIPNGKLKIQFSFVGYTTAYKELNITNQEVTLDIILKPTVLQSEEVVITGGYISSQDENAVKIEVLRAGEIDLAGTPSFSEALTKVPGVDMISKGPGVGKPVIRGLSMNDILVLNNGVRHENYQYSSHHPLGIDEFGIDKVEIIKGPASLLYGSDAIGGVINFIGEKPASVGRIEGDYNLKLFSNTLGMSNNFGIRAAHGKFFGGIRAGHQTHADFLQGGGAFAPNTRFNSISVRTNAGYTGKHGTFRLFYDYNTLNSGLAEDEAVEQITERGRKNEIFYQQFNTHLVSSQNLLYLGKYKLEADASVQNTELIHFGEVNENEIQMNLTTVSYNARVHFPAGKASEYIAGLQGFNQINVNTHNRETILLPDALTQNYSAYTLFKHSFFDRLTLQAGLRYDLRRLSTEAVDIPDDSSAYRPALEKSYGSFSGSAGFTFHLSKKLLLRANLASGYRTPNLAELTSNGPHELRYETGNENLLPENSFETDLSLHYHNYLVTFDLALFYNTISHYIFIAPTGEVSSTGLPVYRYMQSDSRLYGGETGIHLHPEAFEWLHFESRFSYVYGEQQNGSYLPFIPASNLQFDLRGETGRLLFMHQVYAGIATTTAFAQNRPAPEETATGSYTLLSLKAGGKIKAGNTHFILGLSVNNLLDTHYTDHLSTLKEAGLNNPGRNVMLSVKIPFGTAI
ncbi:MAG: TonB-dependent receptor [Bacteroidales bacterium]